MTRAAFVEIVRKPLHTHRAKRRWTFVKIQYVYFTITFSHRAHAYKMTECTTEVSNFLEDGLDHPNQALTP